MGTFQNLPDLYRVRYREADKIMHNADNNEKWNGPSFSRHQNMTEMSKMIKIRCWDYYDYYDPLRAKGHRGDDIVITSLYWSRCDGHKLIYWAGYVIASLSNEAAHHQQVYTNILRYHKHWKSKESTYCAATVGKLNYAVSTHKCQEMNNVH